jgi:hypothetical protein
MRCSMVALLLLGPGPDEVPAPRINTPVEQHAPVEGPAPAHDGPGIEFAIAPPDDDEEEDEIEPAERVTGHEPSWPTPGAAPADGWGMITAGAILMPTAAAATWALVLSTGAKQEQVAVLVTGVAFELLGIGLIATGIHRQAKLKRWTLAYRVIAPPQGAGLLAAGGIALSFGVTLIASGAVAMRESAAFGGSMIGVGVAGLTVIAPLTLYFGKQRRDYYLATGGWYRPKMPTVQLAPRVILDRETFGLGVGGRF